MGIETALPETPLGAKRPFIRATEIWVPNETGTELCLGAGLYGPLTEIEAVAKETRFGLDDGLPGKAWATRQPVVLKDLVGSYFRRGAAASEAGLTCGVALPLFCGSELAAVIVFFCGDDQDHVGAIEVWHAPHNSFDMGLVDGYYGTAEVFEWTARHINFMKGSGLPGQVWASGMPVVMSELKGPRFVRFEEAAKAGITRGVGIPCNGASSADTFVMTLLSALHTPIASRFEIWAPDGAALVFRNGYCETGADLGAIHEGVRVLSGEGIIGRVLADAVPRAVPRLDYEASAVEMAAARDGLTSMVAIPIFEDRAVKAVLAWYH